MTPTGRGSEPGLAQRRPALELRARMLHEIRGWFARHGYLEVETPIRVRTPAMELYIDAEASGDYFLRTSPELHMKRMMAAGYPRIFQIGPCFRSGERGPFHAPEYTMLEWYRIGSDHLDMMEETRQLLAHLQQEIRDGRPLETGCGPLDLAGPWRRETVTDLFREHAGWDPALDFDPDRFDRDMVERVEPQLMDAAPVVVHGFPRERAALAALEPAPPHRAQRAELYLAGLEVANAYRELTDPAEQRARFEAWGRQRRAEGRPVYGLDEPFLEALQSGLPACGGNALGIDRLVLLFAGASRIDQVRAFIE